MRHEKPTPGQPTPIDSVNAELIKAKLTADPLARRTRAALKFETEPGPETRAVIVEDMAQILDEGRVERGYADIYDLVRAGYDHEVADTLGREAAKLMARRAAKRGVREPFEEEAA